MGVAGFIGSNLLDALLLLNQKVIGLDNFSSGHKDNLEEVKNTVSEEQWENFRFIEGDIRNPKTCIEIIKNVDYVLHHAAYVSVQGSIAEPIESNSVNVSGFLNFLTAAKNEGVKNFVYAASSSTYGGLSSLPTIEDKIGEPLSPYAVTKYVNELYADVYKKTYDFNSIGLRYFNVFGKRQRLESAYSAVIPNWITSFLSNKEIFIYGDGYTSRDFCYIDNIVQANILAALVSEDRLNNIYNVGNGDKTSLNELFGQIRDVLLEMGIEYRRDPIYRDFRNGDIRHSQADISKISSLLGYVPTHNLQEGIQLIIPWYKNYL